MRPVFFNKNKIKKMDIQKILADHKDWLNNSSAGARADLSEANLWGAKKVFSFGPVPSSGRICVAVWHGDAGWMVQSGCFWGNLNELEAEVKTNTTALYILRTSPFCGRTNRHNMGSLLICAVILGAIIYENEFKK